MISRGLLSLTTVNNHSTGLPPQEKHPPSWGVSLWRHPATIGPSAGYLKKPSATSQVARAKFSFTIFSVTTAGTMTSMPSWQVSLIFSKTRGFCMTTTERNTRQNSTYLYISIHICSYLVSLTSNSISSLRKRENWSGNRTSKGCIEEPSVTWKLLRGLEVTNYGASCIYMIYCILYIYICCTSHI